MAGLFLFHARLGTRVFPDGVYHLVCQGHRTAAKVLNAEGLGFVAL